MSSRCTRSSNSGFSLVEVLVALTVASVVAGSALTLALSSHRLYETDQFRTTVNQNLRAGMDLLGIDIRQAGERLPGDAPAIEILDGSGGAPDTLILRRNLLDEVLPVCKDISAGSNADSVFVARKKINQNDKIPPGCAVVPDDNSDGWPDNLEAWRAYRLDHGGSVMAYIYNPATQDGEFFVYDAEDNSTFHIHKANGEKWEHTYNIVDGSRVYIIEQLAFQLVDGVLQAVVNGDTANPLHLVSHIEDFQQRAHFRDGSVGDALGPADHWHTLRSIEVTLEGSVEFRGRTLTRTVTTQFFPRNVLSLPRTLQG